MGRYRKIDPKIWNDAKFIALSNDAQRLFLFVLTHPLMTGVGAFRTTMGGMADELRLDPKGFPELFGELLGKGLVKYDERACMIFAPNFLKYNEPENPNVVQGWLKTLEYLPECPLLIEVLQGAIAAAGKFSNKINAQETIKVLESLSERLSKEFGEPFAEPLAKGSGIQRTVSSKQLLPTTSVVGSADKPRRTRTPKREINYYGLPDELVADWNAQRKAKKAPLTQTAVDEFKREADKAGWTLEQAVRFSLKIGSTGFFASWDSVKNASAPQGVSGVTDEQRREREAWLAYCQPFFDKTMRPPLSREQWREQVWAKQPQGMSAEDAFALEGGRA